MSSARAPRAAYASLLALGLLVLLVAAPLGTADAATPNGWTTHAGPGYELYLTPQQQVGASELGLVVNYGDDNMTLRVSKANQTVSSVVIAPHSSRFVQLDFATNGTYQLTLASAGQELLTLSKQRIIPVTPSPDPPVWHDDDWQITPPGPNPWTPAPEPQDPLKYTQAAVDALLANITLEILLTTATVMGVMVAIGALVQRLVKFIYPTDLLTIVLLLANLGLVVLAATGRINMGGALWYIIPELAGYFIGYALGSRNNDWMIQYISPRIGYTYRVPTAIYEHEGRQCIADQSNRALLKRVLFGVHHEIDSDGIRLEPNWTDSAKYRLFPKFEKRMINIESLETSNERVPIWWKFAVKRHTTRIRVAYGSQATAAELVTSVDVLDRLRNKVDQLEAERIRLEEEAPRRVVDALSGLIHPSYERTVTTRIEDFERALRPPEPESERPNPEVTTT
jgi:hypothetical protein